MALFHGRFVDSVGTDRPSKINKASVHCVTIGIGRVDFADEEKSSDR
jgi:hypothetical protein